MWEMQEQLPDPNGMACYTENVTYHMDGSLEMRKRPISQLLNLFQDGGVDVIYAMESGFFPLIPIHSIKINGWLMPPRAVKSSLL